MFIDNRRVKEERLWLIVDECCNDGDCDTNMYIYDDYDLAKSQFDLLAKTDAAENPDREFSKSTTSYERYDEGYYDDYHRSIDMFETTPKTLNYREILDKIDEFDISPSSIDVAFAMRELLEVTYTDEEFERLCKYAEMLYLKLEDVKIDDIVTTIDDLMRNEQMSVDEIIKIDKYDFAGRL